MTRNANNIVCVRLSNGEKIESTDVHPFWSATRQTWVPAGELQFGERLDSLNGEFFVESVVPISRVSNVFNIEAHGHHVFRVSSDGILVHNADPGSCAPNSVVSQIGHTTPWNQMTKATCLRKVILCYIKSK